MENSGACSPFGTQQVMLVVLTGDRGLCGGYNNFILKKVRVFGLGEQHQHWGVQGNHGAGFGIS
jgi:F0F1-type ATP synthase gamma subunit